MSFQKGVFSGKPLVLKFGVEELGTEVLYFFKHVLCLNVPRRRWLGGIRRENGRGWGGEQSLGAHLAADNLTVGGGSLWWAMGVLGGSLFLGLGGPDCGVDGVEHWEKGGAVCRFPRWLETLLAAHHPGEVGAAAQNTFGVTRVLGRGIEESTGGAVGLRGGVGAHITAVAGLPTGITGLGLPLERVAPHDGGAVVEPERHSVSSEENLNDVGVADAFGFQDVVGVVVFSEASHDGRVVVTGGHLE